MYTYASAAQAVDTYVNRTTTTGSDAANIQALVRRAYRATVREIHGLLPSAAMWRLAAETATGGAITCETLRMAVWHDEGL